MLTTSSSTIKRARVTARIAESENLHLPTSSKTTRALLEQIEKKREFLDNQCNEYEQLCKKLAKEKIEKNRLESEHKVSTAELDELTEICEKLQAQSESLFLKQQHKQNELNELQQKLIGINEKIEKVEKDFAKESKLAENLTKTQSELIKKLDLLRKENEEDIKEIRRLKDAFETDRKTEKTLEQYLTRLMNDVFMNQRRLEDLHIGTSRDRATFRQAEKIMRDQKRMHRRFSAQTLDKASKTKTSEENKMKIEKLDEEWEKLQDEIELKEKELIEEIEKTNRIKKDNKEKSKKLNEEMEKQQQLQIAKDYELLQSHTPMYAAYSSSTDLSKNLMEKLEKPVNNSTTIDVEDKIEDNKLEAVLQMKESIFADVVKELPEYSEMLDNRKRILKTSESEAHLQLIEELKRVEGLVSGQRQETQTIEREVKWLDDNIQQKQAEVRFYQKKIEELSEQTKRVEINQKKAEEKANQFTKKLELTSKNDVEQLLNERAKLEEQRNFLNAEIKKMKIETNRLDEQWKIAKLSKRKVNYEEMDEIDKNLESWKLKVEEIVAEVAKLQQMENEALIKNGKLHKNLALLKPYDYEYQEFEKLVKSSQELNKKLAEHENQKQIEELKLRGDIQILQ